MDSDYLKNCFCTTFSKEHLAHPFTIKASSTVKHSIADQKAQTIAIAFFIGLLTLGIGGVIAFYALCTHYKIKKLEQAHLPCAGFLFPKKMKETAITYGLSGGRLGDNLCAYITGRWVAYKNNLPFFNQTFAFSDELALTTEETELTRLHSFKKRMNAKKAEDIAAIAAIPKNNSTLVTIPFGADIIPDWKDAAFKKIIQAAIKPKQPVELHPLPEDRIAIALHVRTGGGFDSAHVRKIMPTKFPPDSFYLDGLMQMTKQHPGKKFYVRLFTDDVDPKAVAERFKAPLKDLDVRWDFRDSGNHHKANVLEDFFNIAQFPCLIRPDSSFSQAAQRIGQTQMAYAPKCWSGHTFEDGKLVVPGELSLS